MKSSSPLDELLSQLLTSGERRKYLLSWWNGSGVPPVPGHTSLAGVWREFLRILLFEPLNVVITPDSIDLWSGCQHNLLILTGWLTFRETALLDRIVQEKDIHFGNQSLYRSGHYQFSQCLSSTFDWCVEDRRGFVREFYHLLLLAAPYGAASKSNLMDSLLQAVQSLLLHHREDPFLRSLHHSLQGLIEPHLVLTWECDHSSSTAGDDNGFDTTGEIVD